MRKSKPRKENYPLAIFLFFILFLIAAGWLLIPGIEPRLEESTHMLALQNRGIMSNGCIVAKDSHEGWQGLPELIYRFPTSGGAFNGRVKVADEVFQQSQVGNCFNVVYLPGDPNVNSLQSYVEAFDLREYWSDYLWMIPTIIGFIIIVILFAVFNYYLRRNKKKKLH